MAAPEAELPAAAAPSAPPPPREPLLEPYLHEEPGLALPSDVLNFVHQSLERLGPFTSVAVKQGVEVYLCTQVFGRARQLRAAPGPNLAPLLHHRGHATWGAVLCRADIGGGAREREAAA
ncbi:MAG: hypothetical protein GY772_14145, partial [bacterium]|nr:hypothetical protein [bacterium]